MKVAVAMSGGVDSSVAAALLKREGHEVVGFFLHLNRSEPHAATAERRCCSLDDAEDARRVSDRLGIDFYALPYRDHFQRIIRGFVEEYKAGRTPYPCVRCNQDLKFGALLDLATGIGADAVATGHYARLEGGRLMRAADPDKDQSYVLFGLTREQLSRALFPVGPYPKGRIREMAEELGLPVAHKPDSQDLCFIPKGSVSDFLKREAPEALEPGEVVDTEGRVLGTHGGVALFTVGQRKGLPALGGARYVLRLDPVSRRVVVGGKEDLLRSSFTASKVNWIAEPEPRSEVQIRYHHRAEPASLTALEGGRVRVDFDRPQAAVAPGQAAVFYRGAEVLGGGWID